MDLVGKKIFHEPNGEGTITAFDGEFITAFFPDSNKSVNYLYPSCFQGRVRLLDGSMTDTISEDIEKKEKEEEEKKAARANKIQTDLILMHERKQSYIKDTEPIRFSSVKAFCDHYTKILQNEINFIKATGGKHITVYEGKLIQAKEGRYYFEFETDTELSSNNGSGITIYRFGERLSGTIENCDENSIIISTEHNLGAKKEETVQSLVFSIEGWRLLESLIERLKEVAESATDICKDLITSGFDYINSDSNIKTGQDKAVEMSCSQPITFIWGPPGTGKTKTLAKIAIKHINNGNRVLMVSYSNVSVDGAIQRVFKHLGDNSRGKALRYGYPKDENIKSDRYKYSFNYALESDIELKNKNHTLRQEYRDSDKLSDRAKELKKEIKNISIKVAEREKELIKEVPFVATTISKALVDKSIFQQKFDVVIFDEASMSYVPQIIAGANLAKCNFICMGDFNQLPPIVQNDTSEYLSVDIFKHCGIYDAVRNHEGHDWLCMLNTQYRMHPQIAEVASKTMYYSLLKTAPTIKDERDKLLGSVPEIAEAYGIADLSEMTSTCIPLQDHSRANILSAFISFALACRAGENYDVGIITPYSSQARLLQNMAKDYADNTGKSGHIPCATVHQFQGSEKDTIIYDAVDCYRLQHPGISRICSRIIRLIDLVKIGSVCTLHSV